jgi:hypothetical protein
MQTWTYKQSPESKLLERELVRCLDDAVFVPAVITTRLSTCSFLAL